MNVPPNSPENSFSLYYEHTPPLSQEDRGGLTTSGSFPRDLTPEKQKITSVVQETLKRKAELSPTKSRESKKLKESENNCNNQASEEDMEPFSFICTSEKVLESEPSVISSDPEDTTQTSSPSSFSQRLRSKSPFASPSLSPLKLSPPPKVQPSTEESEELVSTPKEAGEIREEDLSTDVEGIFDYSSFQKSLPQKPTREEKINNVLVAAKEQFHDKENPSFIDNCDTNKLPLGATCKVLKDTINNFEIWSASCSIQGRRQYQEDFSLEMTFENEQSIPFLSFTGMFDGHGGRDAAHQAVEILKTQAANFFKIEEWNSVLLPESRAQTIDQRTRVIKNLIEYVDNQIVEDQRSKPNELNQNKLKPGSTANCLFVTGHEAWCANAGDSRTIFVDQEGETTPLSRDQLAKNSPFAQQIYEREGFIANGRLNGFLVPARALGDSMLKKGERKEWILRSTPEITRIDLEPGIFVSASDGLWDVASSENVGEAVWTLSQEGKSASEIAKSLVAGAYTEGSKDNITAIVIKILPIT